jgi:hypothetical protein
MVECVKHSQEGLWGSHHNAVCVDAVLAVCPAAPWQRQPTQSAASLSLSPTVRFLRELQMHREIKCKLFLSVLD